MGSRGWQRSQRYGRLRDSEASASGHQAESVREEDSAGSAAHGTVKRAPRKEQRLTWSSGCWRLLGPFRQAGEGTNLAAE